MHSIPEPAADAPRKCNADQEQQPQRKSLHAPRLSAGAETRWRVRPDQRGRGEAHVGPVISRRQAKAMIKM